MTPIPGKKWQLFGYHDPCNCHEIRPRHLRDKIFGRALSSCLHILDDQKEPDVNGVKSLIRFHSGNKENSYLHNKKYPLSTKSSKAEF